MKQYIYIDDLKEMAAAQGWIVDTTGIDVAADVSRAEYRRSGSEWQQELAPSSSLLRTQPGIGANDSDAGVAGEVIVLSPLTLKETFFRNTESAIPMKDPMDLCTVHQEGTTHATQSMNDLFFDDDLESSQEAQPAPILRVFCDFLQEAPVHILLKAPHPNGEDVVKAILLQVLARAREAMGYSSNPTYYQLFMADSDGNSEMPINLFMPIQHFDCFCIKPLIIAKLVGFQRHGLLPSTSTDILLIVHVQHLTQCKVYHHSCIAPADMLADRLEAMISTSLPNNPVVKGSLRICYGHLELKTTDSFDMGPGIGPISARIGDRTILSLYRCGVREVSVRTEYIKEDPVSFDEEELPDVEMTMDEAKKVVLQLPVTLVMANGARLQRLLVSTSSSLITIRVGLSDNKKTVRSIYDIDEVTSTLHKPSLQISYKYGKEEPEIFEFASINACAKMLKKIKLLMEDKEINQTKKPHWFQRIFHWLQ